MYTNNPLSISILEYRLCDKSKGFPSIYQIRSGNLMEFFCRRNCELFVLDGKVYENIGGALEDDCYVIYLEEVSDYVRYPNPSSSRKLGIEVRLFAKLGERKEIEFLDCKSHEMVLAYLDNSFLYFDKLEYERVSAELDQDRLIYVLYVKPTGERLE